METQWTKTACEKLKKNLIWSNTSERPLIFRPKILEILRPQAIPTQKKQNRSGVNSPIPPEFEEPLPANVENANQPAAAFDAEEEAADEQSPIDDDGEFVFQPLQAVSEEAKNHDCKYWVLEHRKIPSSASGQTLKRF